MKVGIIGAGICGLYLAWKLSEKGHKVTVFEKKERVGKETCSGLFSQRILEFIPESQNLIQNQIESCLIHFPARTLKIKFSKKLLVMSHFALDNLVAKLAAASGAKIVLNHPVDSLPNGFDRTIGCDGYNSSVRRILGLPDLSYHLAIQGFIPKNDFSNYVETWPQKQQAPNKSFWDYTGQGFIWKIPKGKEIEYGIIASPREAQELFEKFLKQNSLQLARIKSAPTPKTVIWGSIPSHPSITLCGDASGLIKPWSGGGVIWGLTAADTLLKNFPDFLKYQKVMKNFFLPKIIFSKITTKMVYFLGFKIPWILPKNFKIEVDFLI